MALEAPVSHEQGTKDTTIIEEHSEQKPPTDSKRPAGRCVTTVTRLPTCHRQYKNLSTCTALSAAGALDAVVLSMGGGVRLRFWLEVLGLSWGNNIRLGFQCICSKRGIS